MSKKIISKITSAELLDIIREAGFRVAEESPTEAGDPCLCFGSNGYNCYAYFYTQAPDEEQRSYERVVLAFGLKGEKAYSSEIPNAWGRNRIFGRAFVGTGGGVHFEHLFCLRGGVSVDNIATHIQLWDAYLGVFLHFLDEMANGSYEGASCQVPSEAAACGSAMQN